jgi:hypothetical protein
MSLRWAFRGEGPPQSFLIEFSLAQIRKDTPSIYWVCPFFVSTLVAQSARCRASCCLADEVAACYVFDVATDQADV